ncbi:MAG: hypothetical protein IKN43_02505, partial [Selenomonadaceae bacterium]|nr:hypothetical protein [Selenomonadaceae bacterium]
MVKSKFLLSFSLFFFVKKKREKERSKEKEKRKNFNNWLCEEHKTRGERTRESRGQCPLAG